MATLTIPGGLPSTSRTIVLAVNGGAATDYAWSSKDPLDVLPGVVDASAYLAAVGLSLEAPPVIYEDPSLTVVLLSWTAAGVITMQVGGGATDSVPAIQLVLTLSGGNEMILVVSQPVATLAPAGLILAGPPVTPPQPAGTFVAGAGGITGHHALMADGLGGVVLADPTTAFQFVGISMGAAAAGATASVAEDGATVTEPTWAWTPGAALYVGAAGALTATPPATGWLQQVAVAITATTILVQAYPAILRA